VWKVDIIVMPFGLRRTNETIQQAISYAYFKDIIMLAATSYGHGYSQISYPARSSEVIGIYASDWRGQGLPFNPWAEQGEPGNSFMTLGHDVEIPCLISRKSGTSLAAVIAAGIAALILDFVSQNMKKEYVRRKMFSNDGIRKLFRLASSRRSMTGPSYFAPWLLLNSHSAEYACALIMSAIED
jgi:hypothetical protein